MNYNLENVRLEITDTIEIKFLKTLDRPSLIKFEDEIEFQHVSITYNYKLEVLKLE